MSSIIINGIELRLVPLQSTDGSMFYVSGMQSDVIGYKLYPDGRLKKANATYDTSPNGKYNAGRKQRYLLFKNVLGHGKHILASHAVYLAWSEQGYIPEGWQIDHLNGITTDNCIFNLEAVTPQENARRVRPLNAMRKVFGDMRHIYYEHLKRIYRLNVEQFAYFIRGVQEIMLIDPTPLSVESINFDIEQILDDTLITHN